MQSPVTPVLASLPFPYELLLERNSSDSAPTEKIRFTAAEAATEKRIDGHKGPYIL